MNDIIEKDIIVDENYIKIENFYKMIVVYRINLNNKNNTIVECYSASFQQEVNLYV